MDARDSGFEPPEGNLFAAASRGAAVPGNDVRDPEPRSDLPPWLQVASSAALPETNLFESDSGPEAAPTDTPDRPIDWGRTAGSVVGTEMPSWVQGRTPAPQVSRARPIAVRVLCLFAVVAGVAACSAVVISTVSGGSVHRPRVSHHASSRTSAAASAPTPSPEPKRPSDQQPRRDVVRNSDNRHPSSGRGRLRARRDRPRTVGPRSARTAQASTPRSATPGAPTATSSTAGAPGSSAQTQEPTVTPQPAEPPQAAPTTPASPSAGASSAPSTPPGQQEFGFEQ